MNCALRAVEEGDLPIFFEHQSDQLAAKMVEMKSRWHDEFFAHWRSKVLGDPRNQVRAIVADQNLVGYVAAFDRDERRLIAYWLGRKYWGRGMATAALAMFLMEERRRPIHAFVAAKNRGSMRVLEKCGFVAVTGPTPDHEGVLEYLYRLE